MLASTVRIKRSFAAIVAPLLIAALPLSASARFAWGVGVGFGGPGWGVGVSAGYAPPALPVYTQPAAPYPNYQWIPGYWGWGACGLLLGPRLLDGTAGRRRLLDAGLLGF